MTDLFAQSPPLTPAGQRVLTAAAKMFYERGIHATGVDAIAAEAGVTKKTLYDQFGSKDTLVAAYLVDRARRWQHHLTAVCVRRRTGRGRVLGVFDAIDTWLAGSTRGCAFINAYAEYGDRADQLAVDIVRAEKEWMRTYITTQLSGYAGAARLGAVVHLLYEGALVALTAGGDPNAIGTARRAVDTLLPTSG